MYKSKKMKKILIFFSILCVGCSENTTTTVIEVPTYTLQTNISPVNSGTISPSSGVFDRGEQITITAFPNKYYQFKNWSDPINSNVNPTTITLSKNTTIAVVFQKIDDDEDGIVNDADKCKDTKKEVAVDGNGCSEDQKKDDDNDGVINGIDLCPSTKTGIVVNELGCAIIKDIEGNVYGTITIGEQTWMSENLTSTTYNDGTSIPNIKEVDAWSSTTLGAYSDYENSLQNATNYGRLYNWRVTTKDICPTGWKIPSKEDWETLIDEVGGAAIAGKHLKQTGTQFWFTPNEDFSTNKFGFNAIGGGAKYANGDSDSLNRGAFFWSSTPSNSGVDFAINYVLGFSRNEVREINSHLNNGYSIRCIKK